MMKENSPLFVSSLPWGSRVRSSVILGGMAFCLLMALSSLAYAGNAAPGSVRASQAHTDPAASPLGMRSPDVKTLSSSHTLLENKEEKSLPALGHINVPQEAQNRMRISTGRVMEKSLSSYIVSPAYVEIDDRQLVRIRPVGIGRVIKVYAYPGQVVSPGDVLMEYDNYSLTDVISQVDAAKAVVEEATAQQTEAGFAAHRGDMLQGGALPQGEIQRRRMVLRHMSGLVQEKKALMRNTQMRLKQFTTNTEQVFNTHYSRIISPVYGVVKSANMSMGDMVNPSNLPVVEVVNTSSVWVVSQVASYNMGRVRIGNRQATFLTDMPNEPPLISTVTTIDSSVDPLTRQFLVRSQVTGNKRLYPGMFVRTYIYDTPQKGLVIPRTALQEINGQDVVFVKEKEGEFIIQPVRIGVSSEKDVIVTEGLKAGQIIVMRDSFALKSQFVLN